MGFNNTKWELSDKIVKQNSIEYGDRYVMITGASYDSTEKVYKISVRDIMCDAEFSLTYWLEGWNKDKTERIENKTSVGTLNTLGEALAGVNIGIPNPQDIIGGVVMAEVTKTNPNEQGKTYTRVYKFKPVPGDIAACATIDQYYLEG